VPYRVFNLDEVASYLHLSKQDIQELVKRDEIPCERQGDRIVFRKKNIDGWASQRILRLNGNSLVAYHRKSSAKAHDLSKKHAIIPEILKPEYIDPATTSKTKASVIRDLVKLAGDTGLVPNARDLLKSLEERERLGSTALAGGIALLHPRNHEPYMFEDSFLVVGRTIQPIPFGSPDGSTTDLFFLICCQDDRIHLHVLARICMICHHTSMLVEARDTTNPKAIYELLVKAEEEVVQQL